MARAGILRTNNGEALLGRTLCILVINYETLLGHVFCVCVCFFLRLYLPTIPVSFVHVLIGTSEELQFSEPCIQSVWRELKPVEG